MKWVQNLIFCSGEVFLGEVHGFHPEALAVQVFQASCVGGEAEGQLVGIQGLDLSVKPLVQLAVLAVTQQGMTRVGKLGADLVGEAGDQLAFHKT